MNMLKNTACLLCAGILFVSLLNGCDSSRNRSIEIKNDFEKRKELAANRREQLFDILDRDDLTQAEREGLEFLYAYMPYSDLADYDGEFFLNQVQMALKARDYFSWGNSIPDDIFRHFVLVHRVNNENLDSARSYIFNEIKERIKDMSMYDAALEVNHWCHELVTYRPSDSRTSSPLASIKTAFGRCGEESTFTVTALRAVGIPARQCYTPRWAHTDDNHAWVEAWVDGKWYYMGACEPDAELNMGWFSIPSSRAMLVQSNCYGKYYGDEEVVFSTDLFSRINMLHNYTQTKRITVGVLDSLDNPVEGATVKFKLYNYSEYYPLATSITDKQGTASLTTGLGDLLIWANKDDIYAYEKIDVRNTDKLNIRLTRHQGTEYVDTLDIFPPAETIKKSEVAQAKVEENNRRLQCEDSLRTAYIATFPKESDIREINQNLTHSQLWELIHKSEGNHEEIRSFLKQNDKKQEGLYLYEYMQSLSDKDLRDTPAEILRLHLTSYNKVDYPFDVYVKGIISPRVANELIRPWRQYLAEELPKQLNDNKSVSALIDWIKSNLNVDDTGNYFNCPISPRGVFELRYTDKHSRDIFFVAACRSMNIPAYRDAATGQLFAYENNAWNIIEIDDTRKVQNNGKLILNYPVKDEIKPAYWTHYTIAKFDNGDFTTFDYEDDPRIGTFPVTLDLEPGYYMLSTGNRYSDGNTLSRLDFFTIEDSKTVSKDLVLRNLTPRSENYGKIDMQQSLSIDSRPMKVEELAKTNPLILCFIDPTKEPTKHLLKDIGVFKKEFDKWGGKLLLVISSDKKTADFDLKKWNLPASTHLMYDENSVWMNDIITSTNQYFRDNYPLVFIVDKNGNLIFKTEGYRIGTGELIYKSLLMNGGNANSR